MLKLKLKLKVLGSNIIYKSIQSIQSLKVSVVLSNI